jgi:hypothetical protein
MMPLEEARRLAIVWRGDKDAPDAWQSQAGRPEATLPL